MGVYIKGMEMPFTCLTCDFHKCAAGVGDFCSRTKRRQFRFKNRPEDCPLIEVPEPHGRLIDADAVIDLVMQYCPDDDGVCSKAGADLRELLDEIENLPTVIPAEEEP